MTLSENLKNVNEKIIKACENSQRDPKEVRIIAVTKYIDVEQTREVLNLGIEHIGENKVQHAVPKWEVLSERGMWHFIGHLQTNKVKQIIGKFDYLHSLDRPSLVEAIHKYSIQQGTKIKAFIQVNVSGEDSKGGVDPSELVDFCKFVRQYDTIQVVGLMTMAPNTTDHEQVRTVFRGLRKLKDQINEDHIFQEPLRELSMGMSNDFELAVEEGATFVRLGTILLK